MPGDHVLTAPNVTHVRKGLVHLLCGLPPSLLHTLDSQASGPENYSYQIAFNVRHGTAGALTALLRALDGFRSVHDSVAPGVNRRKGYFAWNSHSVATDLVVLDVKVHYPCQMISTAAPVVCDALGDLVHPTTAQCIVTLRVDILKDTCLDW